MMHLRFLSRIKERGQAPFQLSPIIPQQRGGTGKVQLLRSQKFGLCLFVSGDNFASLDPFRNPQILRQKMGQNSLPAKSYTASKKAGWLKLGILLRKQPYLLVTLPQSAVAG
jgi:hypothetical protein